MPTQRKKTPAGAAPAAALVAIDLIRQDEALQMRCGVKMDHVDMLLQALRDGDALTPLTVFEDREPDPDGAPRLIYFVADGHHRLAAWRLHKARKVPCDIRQGGRDAAFRHALGANAAHTALPRTNKDKRRAVLAALSALPELSLRELADLCLVSHQFVALVKKEVSTVDTPAAPNPPAQLDFFGVLDRDLEPARDALDEVFALPQWADESIPREKRLEAVETVEALLRKYLRKVEDRAQALKAG